MRRLAAGIKRRAKVLCVAALGVGVLVVALEPVVLGSASAGRIKQVHSALSQDNPRANLPPDPNYNDCAANGCIEGPPCFTSDFAPAFTSPNCEQAELEAINNARRQEGIGPMHLPSDYNSLSGDEQLLVVIDLERVGRALPPVAGLVASLDRVAQESTQVSGQPVGTFADPTFPVGFSVGAGTAFAYDCYSTGGGSYGCAYFGNPGASIAAGGVISVLDADYVWMYDDGYGGGNSDCETPQAAGCWGHRDIILAAYPTHTRFMSATCPSSPSVRSPRRATLVMGAGSLQPTGGGPQGNWTAIFASITGRKPAFVYTWQQALAAGAGGRQS
jgi:hypothetical protein